MKGKWRIVKMPDYTSDYPDMVAPAYILFDGEARGDGWAELQPDGFLEGQICFHGGDEADFTAKPWETSSTAC